MAMLDRCRLLAYARSMAIDEAAVRRALGSQRLLLLFGGALVVAVGLTVVGVVFAGHKRADLAFEAAKVGIQLGVITIAGAAITQGLKGFNDTRERRLKRLDIDREERQRMNEYRLGVFRDTVDAYNEVKRVRRLLRAAGLGGDAAATVSAEQLTAYESGMEALNKAELALEKIGREVGAQQAAFAHAWSEIEGLKTSQDYLRQVLAVWEHGGLRRHGEKEACSGDGDAFDSFLAKRSETFGQTFWPSFDAFEKAIRADLLEHNPAAVRTE
jgi:hypothetical protein